MLNNNNHNSACSREEDIVAYLYDELDRAGRTDFETHLAACSVCTDEFASISDARFAVYEWHREEFAGLETPRITIPYAKPAIAAVDAIYEPKGAIARFLENITTLPSFAKAGAAFAALAVTAGIVFFAIKSPVAPIDIASNGNQKSIPVKDDDSANAQKKNVAGIDNPGDDNGVTPEDSQSSASGSDYPGKVVKVSTSTSEHKDRKIQLSNSTKHPKPSADTLAPVIKQKVPTLTSYEDDEDKTPRLADLLEEVGMKE